jgi:hypothetical protein
MALPTKIGENKILRDLDIRAARHSLLFALPKA